MKTRWVVGAAIAVSGVATVSAFAAAAPGSVEAKTVRAVSAAPSSPVGFGAFDTDPFLSGANDAVQALQQVGADDPQLATVTIDHTARDLVVYRVGGAG